VQNNIQFLVYQLTTHQVGMEEGTIKCFRASGEPFTKQYQLSSEAKREKEVRRKVKKSQDKVSDLFIKV